MAGLVPSPDASQPWTAAQSRAQFAALAKLRWSIFRNALRRKGGGGEVIARIIFLPLIGLVAIAPIIGCGFAGYYLVAFGRFDRLAWLTWAIFALGQLVVLNIAPPGLSFDINTIIRFPLSFPRYLTARVFFGLLSASTVIGTLALVSSDIGISIAQPSLALWCTIVFACFALANIFFTRMVHVWVDRWMSTRRAREVLTALILCASLGFQYINIHFNPGFQHSRHDADHLPLLLKTLHYIRPAADILPPGLTASSIVSFHQGHPALAGASLLALFVFGALFFFVYSWRMRREFLGENLSETSQSHRPVPHRLNSAARTSVIPSSFAGQYANAFDRDNTLIACLQKEFIYLRRNINQLYGFVVPIFMVFLFAGRMSASGRLGGFIFPAAVAYSILGISILSYNSLGMDGSGVQLYFFAPARLRDIFLAKNLVVFLLTTVELVLIFVVIVFVAHPPTLMIGIATLCWLFFTVLVNAAVGNLRSLIAPKKIDLSKISRKQASQMSILMAMGIIFGCIGMGFGIFVFANHFGRPWLMIPIFMTLAVLGLLFYLQVLSCVETIAFRHREHISEELTKA
jgi:ABC-2 type transport system permease protein